MSCLFFTPISRRSLHLGVALAALLTGLHPASAQQADLSSSADREIVRRQEDLLLAEKLVSKGDTALAEKDYETAYVNYLDALDRIPAGPATIKQRNAVLGKFSSTGVLYAEALISNGRYSDAEKVAKTVLLPQYNPTYKPAVQLLSNLEQPDYYNKTVTPQLAADKSEVTKLLFEADGFYQAGRFDLAMKRYEQVLNVDPYNIAARRGMEQVNLQRTKYQVSAYDETRSRMLWLADRSWERPVTKFQNGRTTTTADSRTRGGIRGTEAITTKLNRIIIPRIDLRDATIREAVEFLKQQSRQLDNTTDNPKEKKGVNIVLKLDSGPTAAPVVDPNAPQPEAAAPAASANADTRVTLALSNVPLVEALRYLTELAGLKYKIEPFAVSIVPLTENTDELVTKEYRVPPGFIPTNSNVGADTSAIAGSITSTDSRIGPKANALEYLQQQGVNFPPGSFAQYTPTGSRLIVRNTADAIDLIDSLVDAVVGVQPTQVEIESKFLEITQNNLSELGFDWLLGPISLGNGVYAAGGDPGVNTANFPFGATGANQVTSGNRSGVGTAVSSAVTANSIDALIAGVAQGVNAATPGIFGLAGIFTNTQFQVVIRALNQKKGIDLMSAPKVTTKSGQKAVVKVVREFPYPTEFNPPEVPQAQTGSSISSTIVTGIVVASGVVTPTTPTAFETRNLGVTLEVEPIIGPDGYTIDLNLSPEVVEFDGFINYGSPILGPTFNVLTQTFGTFQVTPNVINQPIFSTRKVTTSVSIWDGQTVSLGGLVREDIQKVQDKVPFLGDIPLAGRLFRSNVDQKIKRNLIIFVTARLMDAEGKPIRQDEDQEEIVEPLGLPQEIAPPVIESRTFSK